MTCKVGDRVRFLNDVGGGEVIRIIDRNTIAVLADDGFEVPVLVTEVVLIDSMGDSSLHSHGDRETNHSSNYIQKPNNQSSVQLDNEDESSYDFYNGEPDPEGISIGLHIAFVPIDQKNIVDSDHEFFIINDSPYRVFYSVGQWEGELITPVYSGFLEPDTKELVTSFGREELNKDITLNIQAVFFKNRSYAPHDPEHTDVAIDPRKFFRAGTFHENEFFDQKALIISIADTKKEVLIKSLTDKLITDSIKQKDSPAPQKKQKQVVPEIEEVDLHIHELVDNPALLSPGEIINIQISRFKVALEGGLKGKTRRMVFIHGVGNGKLKHELRKELEKNYPRLRFQDASFREYGYGATMVILR